MNINSQRSGDVGVIITEPTKPLEEADYGRPHNALCKVSESSHAMRKAY